MSQSTFPWDKPQSKNQDVQHFIDTFRKYLQPNQIELLEHFKEKNTIGGLPEVINWFFLCVLSMFAIFLLPRQFQVAVIENNRENHVNKAIWLFPLYLLIFNIFVDRKSVV